MNLWLDDIREPWCYGRVGWIWVKTAQEAIAALSTGRVESLSLDHDLEAHHYPTANNPDGALVDSGTGYEVTCFLETHPEFYPSKEVQVHTMNYPGGDRMMHSLRKTWEQLPRGPDINQRYPQRRFIAYEYFRTQ